MICWHRWSAWQDVARADLMRTSDGKQTGVVTHQDRRCEKCGKLNSRIERASI